MTDDEKPMETFLNTWEEWHALGFGFMDAIQWARDPDSPRRIESKKERQYYRLGYLIGGIGEASVWVIFGALLVMALT